MTEQLNMTTKQFNTILHHLNWSPYFAAGMLGISLSSAHRIARGDQAVPEPVARLLIMYERHGIPQELR